MNIFDENNPISLAVWKAFKPAVDKFNLVDVNGFQLDDDSAKRWAEWLTDEAAPPDVIERASDQWLKNYLRWPTFPEFLAVCRQCQDGGVIDGPLASESDKAAAIAIKALSDAGVSPDVWGNAMGIAYAALCCGSYYGRDTSFAKTEASQYVLMYMTHAQELIEFAVKDKGPFVDVLQNIIKR